MSELEEKYEALKKSLLAYEKVAVAFSGGVDSTFLLKTAHDLLGDKAVAFTAALRSVPAFELEEAKAFCKSEGIWLLVCEMNELAVPEFAANAPDRCYYCKRNILRHMGEETAKLNITNLLEGSNVDDLDDYRPGRRAVLECGVISPLLDAGLTKAEIRALSKALGLPTWDKPAYACLASRIPSGETVTEEKLRKVEAAEAFLMANGFHQMRVRVHGELARIEVPAEDIERLARPEFRKVLTEHFEALGFRYVSLDLGGYKVGSMNPKMT